MFLRICRSYCSLYICSLEIKKNMYLCLKKFLFYRKKENFIFKFKLFFTVIGNKFKMKKRTYKLFIALK